MCIKSSRYCIQNLVLIDPGQAIPRVTQSGNHYNESCLKKVQGDKTNYKPATGTQNKQAEQEDNYFSNIFLQY